MTSHKGSEPAFPTKEMYEVPNMNHGFDLEVKTSGGLSKREWLAGMAMQSLLRNTANGMKWAECNWQEDEVAECAVSMADALLAELEKNK